MRLFIFLVLVLTALASHRPNSEERLANTIKRLQSVFEEIASDKRPPPALEVNLSEGEIVGGIEVIETVQNIFDNLPVMIFLKKQTASVNKIVKEMQKDAQAYKNAIGPKYAEFQDRLLIHIRMIERVGSKLIRLATTSWLSCGVNAAKILHSGYVKDTQKQFSKFLDDAIDIAEGISTDLENIKIEVHKLKEEAITNQRLIKQYFEGQISSLEAQKREKEKLYWICIIPIACPGVIAAVETIKKKIENNKRYLRNLSADLVDDFESAEDHATVVFDIMKQWIPQSQALRTALEHTESVQGDLLPTLQAKYLEDNPEQAGIQDAYLTRLFIAMQGLQKASERLEGFSTPDVKCTGVSRVPDYPTQHQVCACQTINIDDWVKSKQCKEGAGAAMQDVENFPFCRLKDESCRNDIKNFLPNVCKNGSAWPKDASTVEQLSAPCKPLFKPGAAWYAANRHCDKSKIVTVAMSNTLRCKDGSIAESQLSPSVDKNYVYNGPQGCYNQPMFQVPTQCPDSEIQCPKSFGHRWYVREGDRWYLHSEGNKGFHLTTRTIATSETYGKLKLTCPN